MEQNNDQQQQVSVDLGISKLERDLKAAKSVCDQLSEHIEHKDAELSKLKEEVLRYRKALDSAERICLKNSTGIEQMQNDFRRIFDIIQELNKQ